MSHILTDLGEEYLLKTDLSGVPSLTLGLYNDSTDAISDPDDLAAVTTEPGNSNYARQTMEITVEDVSGDWGFNNDNQESFDFSDQTTSETIDSYFLVANFQASDTGDASATDHLIATGALDQSRDIGSIDTLNISASGVEVTLS